MNVPVYIPAVLGAVEIADVAISVLIFAAVASLIVAVFGMPGQIQVSPQRQAALSTGHTDRRTIFEQGLLRPIAWLMLAMAYRLAIPRAKEWIRRKLVAAGSPNYYTSEEYLALSLMAGLALGAVVEIAELMLSGRLSVLWFVMGFAAGLFASLYYLYDLASRRLRQIGRKVPYSLDLIALAMGAGATFQEAVRTVVRGGDAEAFHVELRAMLAEMDLGATRRAAMQNLADRIPLEALQSIVASVIQAEELGTPLGEVLHAQANLLRLQRSVRAENLAAVAGVRILIPSLLILISVVLTVFAPAIVKAVRGGLF
jgi:tight adherence protein C